MSEGEAKQLCNRVFELDSSIYGLTVVDGVGRMIWQSVSKNMPRSVYRQEPSESSIKNYTSQVAIVSSMFRLAEDPLGKSKFIISVYERLSLLIFAMAARNASMVVLVPSGADVLALAQKIYAVI